MLLEVIILKFLGEWSELHAVNGFLMSVTGSDGFLHTANFMLVSPAAMFWDVTQRSPNEMAAHIRTTFL